MSFHVFCHLAVFLPSCHFVLIWLIVLLFVMCCSMFLSALISLHSPPICFYFFLAWAFFRSLPVRGASCLLSFLLPPCIIMLPAMQVEHPVTEGLSLANLPSVQLQVHVVIFSAISYISSRVSIIFIIFCYFLISFFLSLFFVFVVIAIIVSASLYFDVYFTRSFYLVFIFCLFSLYFILLLFLLLLLLFIFVYILFIFVFIVFHS